MWQGELMGCYSRGAVQRVLYILGGKRRQNNGAWETLCQCPGEHQARLHSVWPGQSQHRTGELPQPLPLHREAFEVSPVRVHPMKMESGFKERKAQIKQGISKIGSQHRLQKSKGLGQSRKHLPQPRTILVTLAITLHITCPGPSKDCSGRNRLWRLGNFLSLQTQLSFYSCFSAVSAVSFTASVEQWLREWERH